MIIKYYLTKGKKECTLRACIYENKTNQFKVNIPYKIESKYWDHKKQLAKKSMHGYQNFNSRIEMLKLEMLSHINKININGTISWEDLKSNITSFIKGGDIVNHISEEITILIDSFIQERRAEYKAGTIRKYEILKTLIKHYEVKYKLTLKTDTLNYESIEKFRQYVLYDRDNRNDTAYRMIAALKCVIRWLLKQGYEINQSTLKVSQPVKNKYDIVTLSEAEIQIIRDANLSPEQLKVRDCFLFQIYTGQRFSDMQQLSPDQVKDHMWVFRSLKTDKLMHIPFVGWTASAEEIADKYNFKFPQYTSQYFNRALKLICKNAGIDTQVQLTRYQGSRKIIIDKPKHQLISSHTARRTAVSILLAKGVPPTVVMKLTGHSDIKTMMKYERTTTELLEQALLKI